MEDNARFSPLIQQHIDEFHARIAAERVARETDLEYLRRVRPEWSEERRMSVMFMCIVANVKLREQVRLLEDTCKTNR